MSNYANLKSAIQSVIKTNGNNEITGQLLQNELLAMITTLGYGYQFMGVASPDTVPGTPDAKVFYIAYTPGTYTNFGGIVVTGLCVLKYVSSWTKEDIPVSGGGGTDFTVEPTDLTLESGTPNKLKFADRPYNTTTPDGLGYKILRKDLTFAEQVTDINTIYEIRYGFDLANATVTIPAGCVLKFNGGHISNGEISMNGCGITASNENIFRSVTITGYNGDLVVDWFIEPSDTDDNAGIQKALNTPCGRVVFSNRQYNITGINIPWTKTLNIPNVDNIHTGPTLVFNDTTMVVSTSSVDSAITISCPHLATEGKLLLDCRNNVAFGIKFLNAGRCKISAISIYKANIYGILFVSSISGQTVNNDFGDFSQIDIRGCGKYIDISNFTISSLTLTIPKSELDTTEYVTDAYTFDAFYQIVSDGALNPLKDNTFVDGSGNYQVKVTSDITNDLRIYQGGGICFIGSDSQRYVFNSVDIISAPIAVRSAALYGNIFNGLTMQVVGIGISEGSTRKGTWPLSDIYVNPYWESVLLWRIAINTASQRLMVIGGVGVTYADLKTEVYSPSAQFAGLTLIDSTGGNTLAPIRYVGSNVSAATIGEHLVTLFYDGYTTTTAKTITIDETVIQRPRFIVFVGVKRKVVNFVCSDTTKKINGVTTFSLPAIDRWIRIFALVNFGGSYLLKELNILPSTAADIVASMNINSQWGTTIDKGDNFYDTDLGMPVWWPGTGSKFYDANGYTAAKKSGTTRPTLTANDKGFQFFDESISKPIWWDGTAWVDATGTSV